MARLREMGARAFREGRLEEALACLGESARRNPADFGARLLAARCLVQMGERERALTALDVTAEALLKHNHLLPAILAVKLALKINPAEKRLKATLTRIHARAASAATGRATGLAAPAEEPVEGAAGVDLTDLKGGELVDRVVEVLLAEDPSPPTDPGKRPPLPLFADVTPEAFVDLVERMSFRELPPEARVVKEGDPGDSIFVLIDGRLRVVRETVPEPRQLATLGAGALFGELALLTGAPRSASIFAATDVALFEISRDDLNYVAQSHPMVPRAIAEFGQRRLAMNLLATAPLFTNLPGDQRSSVLKRFQARLVAAGERVILEGSPSPGLFLVLSGELTVVKRESGGGEVTLGLLKDGDVFGEISLVTGNAATATVAAVGKSAVAVLPRKAFEELVQSYPQIEDFLVGLSQERLAAIAHAVQPAEVMDADELVENA